MEVGEAVAIVLRLHHPGKQVVGRVRGVAAALDLGVDDAGQLGEPAADPDAALGRVLLRPRAVQQLLAPVRDLVVVLLGDPQGLGRDGHGQHRAETGHEVATARGLDPVEEPVGEPPRERLDLGGRARRERPVQQPAHPRVQRRVDLAEEALLVRHDDTRAPEALGGGKPAGVLEGRRGVRVARGVDEALHRARHRALRAQPFHQRPHVLGLGRVERVEREIRAVVAHALSSVYVVVMPVSMLYA